MTTIGRPTVMTPETIAKLEEAFLFGANDKEAYFLAGVSSSTFYAYCQENPDFSERKELLKEQVKVKAKMTIAKAIDAGDKALSQWYLERRDRDFKPKSDLTSDDKPLPILNVLSNNSHEESGASQQEN